MMFGNMDNAAYPGGVGGNFNRPGFNGLERVNGIEGAKGYRMPPNSVIPLFDANEDIFFLKVTDNSGFPTYRAFRFAEININQLQPQSISRAEFDELKEMIKNVQQSVSANATVVDPAAK